MISMNVQEILINLMSDDKSLDMIRFVDPDCTINSQKPLFQSAQQQTMMDFMKKQSATYHNIAYLYAAVGYIAQAFLNINFKIVTETITPFHALLMRATCLLTFNVFLLRRQKQSPYITRPFVFRQVLKRLCFSTTFAMLSHYALKYLPISTVSSLSNLSPIFAFFIEGYYFNKPINKVSVLITSICFLGVLLIIKPQFLFHQEIVTDLTDKERIYLSCMVIVGAYCFAMSMIYIYDIRDQIQSNVNLHYSYLSHLFVSAILCNFYPISINYDKVNLRFFIFFSLLVISALITQYFIYVAMTLKKPSYLMPFAYLTIIVSFIADILVFGTSFDIFNILGIILTSAGLFSRLIISDENVEVKKELDENGETQQDRLSREQYLQKI